MATPYADTAPLYRARGIPVRPTYGKECKEMGWQLPDHEQDQARLDRWLHTRAECNIAALMGFPAGDGTLVGALDLDHDDPGYLRLVIELLGNPPCGRVGKKGAVFFVRYSANIGKVPLKYLRGNKLIAEWLLKGLAVLPPSIHPDTGQPYRWLGTPLHEIDLTKLPFIGE